MTRLQRLQKCGWCGEVFTVDAKRQNNAVKYCSRDCRIEARRESNREATRKYRKMKQNDENRGHLLGESHINEHPSSDFKKEYIIVRNEKRRLGL